MNSTTTAHLGQLGRMFDISSFWMVQMNKKLCPITPDDGENDPIFETSYIKSTPDSGQCST
jgi:hypothetical protein